MNRDECISNLSHVNADGLGGINNRIYNFQYFCGPCNQGAMKNLNMFDQISLGRADRIIILVDILLQL